MHQIKLRQGSAQFLRDCLSTLGWATSLKDSHIGGIVVVEILPPFPEPPAADSPELEAWKQAVLPEFQLTDIQVAVCKKAIEAVAKTGNIPTDWRSLELYRALGFSPE